MTGSEGSKRLLEETADAPPAKRLKLANPDIPCTSHYHASWMHVSTVTAALASEKYGFVVTASEDGVVKFWKRQSATNPQPLEFVKSFTAHVGSIAALAMDQDTCCSVGVDGWIKFYDVSTFDATAMIATKQSLGRTCALFRSSVAVYAAVASAINGNIFIYSPDQTNMVQTISLHGSPVTSMAFNETHSCMVSCDRRGGIELWDCSGDDESLGAPLSSRHGISYSSKVDSDLYILMKKKTFGLATAVAPDGTAFCVYGADQKIRILKHTTGKVIAMYDERLKAYDKIYDEAPYGLDDMEYGKRTATEREVTTRLVGNSDGSFPDSIRVQFSPCSRYLLVPSIMGIKVLLWEKGRLVGIIGEADAQQLRFLSLCLCPGDAKVSKQMQLARNEQQKSSAEKAEEVDTISDALLVALAYNQRRFYVFSHRDLLSEADGERLFLQRDVWNEAPTVEDQVVAPQKGESATAQKAILRTSKGDIHIQLYPQPSRTIENFVAHARSGYYDGVTFHRVIKGFMLQTGDPLGDGTGGESCWGGEFEDEFFPDLRHDRPFTVSMANAGPNTNGSQFFITTVPCPWLDNKHTVFGRIVRGMDICTMIENVETNANDKPLSEIKIIGIDLQ